MSCACIMFISLDPVVQHEPAKADGKRPSECRVCQALLEQHGLTHDALKNTIAGMKERVKVEVLELANHKPLRKKQRMMEEKASVKMEEVKKEQVNQVKEEQCDDSGVTPLAEVAEAQPSAEANPSADANPSKKEELMGKDELCNLHRLVILERKTHGKTFPVHCTVCDTVFCGRNRARVWQHVTGYQHRKRWRNVEMKMGMPVLGPENEMPSQVIGKCMGLRLGSDIGRKTRLGSDLKEVWNEYSKFAWLERTV